MGKKPNKSENFSGQQKAPKDEIKESADILTKIEASEESTKGFSDAEKINFHPSDIAKRAMELCGLRKPDGTGSTGGQDDDIAQVITHLRREYWDLLETREEREKRLKAPPSVLRASAQMTGEADVRATAETESHGNAHAASAGQKEESFAPPDEAASVDKERLAAAFKAAGIPDDALELLKRLKNPSRTPSSSVRSNLRSELADLIENIRRLDRAAASGPQGYENAVDAVIHYLRRQPLHQGAYASIAKELWPSMRGYLENQTQKGKGWYASLAALPVMLSTISDRQAERPDLVRTLRMRSACYYHEILCLAVQNHRVDERLIDQASNNLSVATLELGGRKAEVMNIARFVARATLAYEVQNAPSTTPSEFGTVLEPLLHPVQNANNLGRLPYQIDAATRISAIIDSENFPHQAAHAYLFAAVLRALRKEHDRVASSFFNAGVVLSRDLGGKAPITVDTRERLEAVFYALALLWALRTAPDRQKALTEGDGFKCLVNLSGSVDALGNQATVNERDLARYLRQSLRDDLQTIPVSVHHEMARQALLREAPDKKLPAPERLTEALIQESVKELNKLLSGKPHRPPAYQALEKILGQDMPSGEIGPTETVAICALALYLLNGSMEKWTKTVTALVEKFAESAKDNNLMETLQKIYDANMQMHGPLVAAGIMTKEDWAALYDSRMVPCTKLTEALEAAINAAEKEDS